MVAFATIPDYEAIVQHEVTGIAATAVDRALESVATIIRNYTGQTISLVEDDVVTVNGNGRQLFMLPQIPIVEITAATTIDRDDVVTDIFEDVKLYDAAAGLVWRTGCGFPCGIQNVTFTYTHGYAVIPADIVTVNVLAAKDLIRRSTTTAGLSSETVGPFVQVFDTAVASESDIDPYKDVLAHYHAPRIPVA